MELNIKLNDKISENTIDLLESNLIYVDASILSFKIAEDFISLTLKSETDLILVEEKVLQLIQKLKPQKNIPINIAYNNKNAKVLCEADVFKELIANKSISILQDGIVSISGLPLHMMEALDENILKFAKGQRAKKILLPITVGFKDLLDSHYFDRTPQHANFISTIEESSRSITNFSKTFKKGSQIDGTLLKAPHSMCRSAVCLNCYPTMRNEVFSDGESRIFTAEGRVFRHEYKKVNSLERLYEFSCREVIYLGTKDFVKVKLKECEVWFVDFLTKFNLNGVIQSATDPFFLENARSLQFYQAVEDSKYEIRVLNPFSKTDVSIGSLNFHGNHFSKSYNIEFKDGSSVQSGCVGFGLERTIFTVLAQYGLDFKNWPVELKLFFNISNFEEEK